MNRLRILYLLADRGHDVNLHHGYAVHVRKILQHLELQGHDTFFLTINENPQLSGFKNYRTLPHRYLRGAHKLVSYTGLFNSARIFNSIRQISKSFKFDILHERFGLNSLGGLFAARYFNVPYILEVNAPLIEEKQLFNASLSAADKFVAERISRLNGRNATTLITVSDYLKTLIHTKWKIAPDKIHVLPNASDNMDYTDIDNAKKLREKLGLGDKTTIGYVGTFQPWFGIENLLEAFRIAAARADNLQLIMVGTGAELENCKQTIAARGLTNRAHFTGAMPHDEIPKWLSIMDIVVAPYKNLVTGFYGSSMKIFEYMAAGKAIIASELGQIPQILEHERNALLVAPGDVNDLVTAILRLAGESGLRVKIGRNARELALQKHTWSEHIRKIINIYQSVLHEE